MYLIGGSGVRKWPVRRSSLPLGVKRGTPFSVVKESSPCEYFYTSFFVTYGKEAIEYEIHTPPTNYKNTDLKIKHVWNLGAHEGSFIAPVLFNHRDTRIVACVRVKDEGTRLCQTAVVNTQWGSSWEKNMTTEEREGHKQNIKMVVMAVKEERKENYTDSHIAVLLSNGTMKKWHDLVVQNVDEGTLDECIPDMSRFALRGIGILSNHFLHDPGQPVSNWTPKEYSAIFCRKESQSSLRGSYLLHWKADRGTTLRTLGENDLAWIKGSKIHDVTLFRWGVENVFAVLGVHDEKLTLFLAKEISATLEGPTPKLTPWKEIPLDERISGNMDLNGIIVLNIMMDPKSHETAIVVITAVARKDKLKTCVGLFAIDKSNCEPKDKDTLELDIGFMGTSMVSVVDSMVTGHKKGKPDIMNLLVIVTTEALAIVAFGYDHSLAGKILVGIPSSQCRLCYKYVKFTHQGSSSRGDPGFESHRQGYFCKGRKLVQ